MDKNNDICKLLGGMLGRTSNGDTKPKTCWEYVKTGKCEHCKEDKMNEGKILNNKWHPDKNEKEYLYEKTKGEKLY